MPLEATDKLRVLAEASEITTPLIEDNWRIMLAEYPYRTIADFFISEFKRDFMLTLLPCGTWFFQSAKQNLYGAVEHPEVVESYLAEVGRISGPFHFCSVPHTHISRLGLSPRTINPINGN